MVIKGKEGSMRRLEQLRKNQHLTMTKLSFKARVHPGRIGQIESGRATPPRDGIELIRLAAALDYDGDPADLLDDVTEMRGAS
jgi:transcriptional regulator with XRE-family HTH domain